MDAAALAFGWIDAAILTALGLLILSPSPFDASLKEAMPIVAGQAAFMVTARSLGLYFWTGGALKSHLARLSFAAAIGDLCALLAGRISAPSVDIAFAWSICAPTVLALTHLCAWFQVSRWRADGRLTPNVVVVGATENAKLLIEEAIRTKNIAVLGVFDDRLGRIPGDVAGVPVLGDTAALLSHPMLPFVDRIVITVPPSAQDRVRGLIERLKVLPNALTLFMDIEGVKARGATLSRIANAPLADVSGGGRDAGREVVKRIEDIVLGAAALFVALPVMAAVAVAIRLDSPGPIFFRQRRHGFNNEAITVWKFRSMRVEAADATASRQVSANDDRVTRVGRIIRKLSLDELPQLFNVLTGEMSLVGPRPHAIGMKTAGEDSARLVAEYAWRHRVKPGLTGWAQVNGSIGAVDTPELVRRRVALDIEYIESQSLWFDLRILAGTLPALILARNAVR